MATVGVKGLSLFHFINNVSGARI